MRKWQTIVSDGVTNRWTLGEIGEEIPNNMPEKYFICLRFPGMLQVELFGRKTDVSRVFYFYEGEVREVGSIET